MTNLPVFTRSYLNVKVDLMSSTLVQCYFFFYKHTGVPRRLDVKRQRESFRNLYDHYLKFVK